MGKYRTRHSWLNSFMILITVKLARTLYAKVNLVESFMCFNIQVRKLQNTKRTLFTLYTCINPYGLPLKFGHDKLLAALKKYTS